MKKQVIGGLASILVTTLIISQLQSSDAVSYSGHDGSVSKYLEKVTVKQYANKKDYWVYEVKACAKTHNLAIAEVILKSDIDKQVLGVNKVILKGKCSHYGAVMKAKDGNTLGAELVQKHQAVEKMEQILKDSKNASKSQKKIMMNEFIRIYTTIGLMPRI
jgi:hypothetical protein